MILNLAVIAIAAAPLAPPANGLFRDRHRLSEGPAVEVWTNKDDDLLRRGDQVRVYFRASESGYVTVFRIDTDGRVRVLYPTEPWEDNYARAGQRYEVRGYADRQSFTVDDYPGEGYVFAVASRDPFNYGNLVRGDHWDYRVIAEGGRVAGDPYVALTDLVDRIVPVNYSEYSYDVLPYYVEERHQYPRFLCYECHAYASYSYWNPYAYSCFRFRIVIYDDFYYQPYRRYGGTRVIYRSAPRIAPRYVFKDRGPSEAYVTTVRERPVDQTGRRLVDRGVTARDLGASGQLPTPVNTGRVRPELSSDRNSGASSGVTTPGGYSGTGRRTDTPPATSGGSSTPAQGDGRRGGVANPNDRPGRQGTVDNSGSGTRRPVENIVPTVPGGDNRQPTLERRDPRQEPGRQPETREQPQPNTANEQPRVQPRSEPRREPARGQVERQPETRQQPQPESRQPERRAEPKAQPSQAPAQPQAPAKAPEKSDDESSSSGRRRN